MMPVSDNFQQWRCCAAVCDSLQVTICAVISDGQGLSVQQTARQLQSCDSYKVGSCCCVFCVLATISYCRVVCSKDCDYDSF